MLHELFTNVLLGVLVGALSAPFLTKYCRYLTSRESRDSYLEHWSNHDSNRERQNRNRGHWSTFSLVGLVLGYAFDSLSGFQPSSKVWGAVALLVAMTVAGMVGRSKMEQHEEMKGDYIKVWCGIGFTIGFFRTACVSISTA